MIERIEKLLDNNNIWATIWETDRYISIEIVWGDWKHDHLRTKWLIEENFDEELEYFWENVIEDDGSDCYSAIHRYIKR